MKIYWIKAQAPKRVLALAKHLGIEAELVEVNLMSGGLKAPEYARLNPNMKAPTLVDGVAPRNTITPGTSARTREKSSEPASGLGIVIHRSSPWWSATLARARST